MVLTATESVFLIIDGWLADIYLEHILDYKVPGTRTVISSNVAQKSFHLTDYIRKEKLNHRNNTTVI